MTEPTILHGLYGAPPVGLADAEPTARQFSPLEPGSGDLSLLDPGALASLTVLAPPGAIERRFVLAHALRVLRPGAPLVVLAPRDRGGARIRAELELFGCQVAERAKAHHRICSCERPEAVTGIADAIGEGGPRLLGETGLWTQPGIFAFDRVDPGTAFLLQRLPPLRGTGADLGSGLGIIARAVLTGAAVERLHLVEIDRRAVEASRRNVADARASIHWADARQVPLAGLDFVVSNPPFHAAGAETRLLGQDFVRTAARILQRGGVLHLVANRHLPYENVLRELFRKVETRADEAGYKLFEAVK